MKAFLLYLIFLLLQLPNVALALPASGLTILFPVSALLPNDSVTSAESVVKGITSLSNNTNLGDHFIEYRIPDTQLLIALNLKTAERLVPESLYDTLLKTQTRIRALELVVPNLINTPLVAGDDPFVSLPADSVGAFFGITHWPADETPTLTYGMVDMALTGLLDVLVSQRRFCAATFLLRHDVLNHVGLGRVDLQRQMLHTER